MRHTTFVTSVGLAVALALAAPSMTSAQDRDRGRARGQDGARDNGRANGGNGGRDSGQDNGRRSGRAVQRGPSRRDDARVEQRGPSRRDDGRADQRRQGGRPSRPPVIIAPNRGRTYYYNRGYRPSVNLGFFYGYPGYYGAYGYRGPSYGYVPYGYDYRGYGAVVPYGYGYDGYGGRPYGGVRIDLPQRDAEVFADGYFVGTVDNFDGVLQQANLEAGPHRIEIRDEGYEPIFFDVNVEPGRTITYRASMRPLRP